MSAPERLGAEACDEGAMGCPLGVGQARRTATRPHRPGCGRCPTGRRRARAHDRQVEIGLLAADQLDIDLGQELGVEQRAVLGAARNCRCRSGAQSASRVFGRARMLAAGQRQRVDDPRHARSAGGRARANSALRKPMSKPALWMTSRRVADEVQRTRRRSRRRPACRRGTRR